MGRCPVQAVHTLLVQRLDRSTVRCLRLEPLVRQYLRVVRLSVTAGNARIAPEPRATRSEGRRTRTAVEEDKKGRAIHDESRSTRVSMTQKQRERAIRDKRREGRSMAAQEGGSVACADRKRVGTLMAHDEEGEVLFPRKGDGLRKRQAQNEESEATQAKRPSGLRGLSPDSTAPTSQIIADFIARHFPHVEPRARRSAKVEAQGRSPEKGAAAGARQPGLEADAAGSRCGQACKPLSMLATASPSVPALPGDDKTVALFT